MQFKGLEKLKGHKEAMSVALIVVSAVLAILVVVKLAGFFTTSAWAKELASMAALGGKNNSADLEKNVEKMRTIADELKRKNLFAPPEPKKNPVSSVPGILGSEAFINGRWYREGQNIADAKIVKIDPTEVKVEWDGREQTFLPLDAVNQEGGPGGGPSKGMRGNEGQPPQAVVQGNVPPVPMMNGPSADMRQQFMQMRERFQNMSEQERAAFREQMRARFSARGGGEFGGRGSRDFGNRGGRGGGNFGGRGR